MHLHFTRFVQLIATPEPDHFVGSFRMDLSFYNIEAICPFSYDLPRGKSREKVTLSDLVAQTGDAHSLAPDFTGKFRLVSSTTQIHVQPALPYREL